MKKTIAILVPVLVLASIGGWILTKRDHTVHRPPSMARPGVFPETPFIGVRESNLPGNWSTVQQFQSATGVTPRLVLYYSNWREPFRYGFAKTAAQHGAAVLVQIQPWKTPLSSIAAGHYDTFLKSYARSVREFRSPVVVGFGHEMNGDWYPWGFRHESAADFVAAWQHIVTVFREQHASNVTWLWTVSRSSSYNIPAFWPGDKYVTWVGLDGYYYQKNQDFTQVFGPAIKRIRQLTRKPILLSETAIGPVAGQSRYIPDLFSGISQYHLRGLVWFDVAQNDSPVHQDWRLEGHAAALTAFRQAVAAMMPGHFPHTKTRKG